MKVSYNWLKQYVNCDLSAEEIAKKLTGTGLEVEDLTPYESIKGALKAHIPCTGYCYFHNTLFKFYATLLHESL